MGAVITAMVAVYQTSVKYRRDGFNARIDEFCKLVLEAADYGADYWVSKKISPDSKKSTPEARLRMKTMEARIGGYQQKISLFFIVIRPFLKIKDRDRLTDLLGEFFDSMTGGSFGAKVRADDESRANLVYTNGSELVAYLRVAKPTVAWHSVLVIILFLGVSLFVLSPVASRLLSKKPILGAVSIAS